MDILNRKKDLVLLVHSRRMLGSSLLKEGGTTGEVTYLRKFPFLLESRAGAGRDSAGQLDLTTRVRDFFLVVIAIYF